MEYIDWPVRAVSPDLAPERKHETDGAFDLRLEDDLTISPGEPAMVSLGISSAIPEGSLGLLFMRSSIAHNYRLALTNKVGLIDASYRGTVKASLVNEGMQPVYLDAGTRLAQLAILPLTPVSMVLVDGLNETERGSGGFGSTGEA